jgi:hypothetical protein
MDTIALGDGIHSKKLEILQLFYTIKFNKYVCFKNIFPFENTLLFNRKPQQLIVFRTSGVCLP